MTITMKLVYYLVLFKTCLCLAYDITLDDKNDVRGWSFKGNFTYIANLSEGGNFTPPFEITIGSQALTENGVWYFTYTKQSHPNGSSVNYAEIKYSLSHHLMAEVIVRLLANPSVVVEMRGSRGKLLQMFRSTGQGWCDASFDIWKQLGSEVIYLKNVLFQWNIVHLTPFSYFLVKLIRCEYLPT